MPKDAKNFDEQYIIANIEKEEFDFSAITEERRKSIREALESKRPEDPKYQNNNLSDYSLDADKLILLRNLSRLGIFTGTNTPYYDLNQNDSLAFLKSQQKLLEKIKDNIITDEEIKEFISINLIRNDFYDKQDCTSPLIIAAKNGNKAVVEHLINLGADVNYHDKLNNTALTYAIQYTASSRSNYILDDYITIIHLLLQKANQTTLNEAFTEIIRHMNYSQKLLDILTNLISKVDEATKSRAIIIITKKDRVGLNDKTIIETLLPYADQHSQNAILVWASKNNYEDLVQKVINNANQKDKDNALIQAISNGYQNIVNLLLEHGADVNTVYGSLSCERLFQYPQILSILIPKVNQKIKDSWLFQAVKLSNAEIVSIALQNGANPNSFGSILLIHSINNFGKHKNRDKDKDIMEIINNLIKKGANTQIIAKEFDTDGSLRSVIIQYDLDNVLYYAMRHGSNITVNIQKKLSRGEKCKTLIQKQISTFNAILEYQNTDDQKLQEFIAFNMEIDENGKTPLFAAAEVGNLKLVKHLVDNNAKVNYKSYFDPLNIAIKNGYIDVVEFLIERKADTSHVYIVDFHDIIIKHDKDNLLPYLFSHKSSHLLDCQQKILEADNAPKCKEFVENQLNLLSEIASDNDVTEEKLQTFKLVSLRDKDKNTILMLAAKNNNVKAVTWLVENTYNENTEEYGMVLSFAIENNHINIVQILIGKGLYISKKLLESAVKKGFLDIVNILVANADAESIQHALKFKTIKQEIKDVLLEKLKELGIPPQIQHNTEVKKPVPSNTNPHNPSQYGITAATIPTHVTPVSIVVQPSTGNSPSPTSANTPTGTNASTTQSNEEKNKENDITPQTKQPTAQVTNTPPRKPQFPKLRLLGYLTLEALAQIVIGILMQSTQHYPVVKAALHLSMHFAITLIWNKKFDHKNTLHQPVKTWVGYCAKYSIAPNFVGKYAEERKQYTEQLLSR